MNRTVPRVKAPELRPTFSAEPKAAEISTARVFGEQLVATGPTRAEEDAALANAIEAYLDGNDTEDVSPFLKFLELNPKSQWRASLLWNVGGVYRRKTALSRAIASLEEAWASAKDSDGAASKAVADAALGELVSLHATLGHMKDLERLLGEVEGRTIGGSAGTRVNRARWELALLTEHHEMGVPSGRVALDRVLRRMRVNYQGSQRLQAFHGTLDGMSLTDLHHLSTEVGLPGQMAFRSDGEIVVPSIVHLSVKHFSAIVAQDGDHYVLDDPSLGGQLMRISKKTLLAETSGYFYLPSGVLASGYRAVDDDEGQIPRNNCSNPMPGPYYRQGDPTTPCPSGDCGPCPMAQYRIHLQLPNLNIFDTPLGYVAPRGAAVHFRVDYNNSEEFQPQVFSYSNLGQRWTFNWMSYVVDDPTSASADVSVYLRGGSQDLYSGYDAATQAYDPERTSHAYVARTSSSPIRYERRLKDGSIEVFAQPNGASTFPRKIFMTSAVDPQGNSINFTYDSNFRLVAVTDAIGQVTTLSYDNPDPLRITKVTDPFGRFATFEYDGVGQLVQVTDVIGIRSRFSYDASGSIIAMTTPYGTTTFKTLLLGSSLDPAVEATDPMGGREKVVYQTTSTVSDTEALVPTGVALYNTGLSKFNTFYWDKRAMSLHPEDTSKAHMFHWLPDDLVSMVDPIKHSEKAPLENRVWYAYAGQSNYGVSSSSAEPTAIARVLTNGESQIFRYEHNLLGNVTRRSDPLGRARIYSYDSAGINVLEIRQVSGQSTELLQSTTYNSQHRPLTQQDVAGQTTTYSYNAQGQVLTMVSPARSGLTLAERTTTFAYDSDGYLQSVSGPMEGATTSVSYDGYGRPRTVTDSEGYTITTDYDVLDRPTKWTYPDGTYEQTVYDRLDAAQHRDRLGRWTKTFYDGLRRRVAVREAIGRTTHYQWCNCGSLDKIIDANGKATNWVRDLQGRVTSEIRPDGATWSYTYEGATSRLHARTDPRGQVTTYTYYRDNLLGQIDYSNTVVPTATVALTYDNTYKRVSSMVDGVGTTSYVYYPATAAGGLGAGKVQSISGPFANSTVSYAYDELGRVTSHGLSTFSTAATYDALGRSTAIASPMGSFLTTYINATSRPLATTFPNGQSTTYSYADNLGDQSLQQIKHQTIGGVTLSQFEYGYDTVGNLKTWLQQLGTEPAKTYSFAYDKGDQLATAVQRNASTQQILKNFGYAYDAAGNRTMEAYDAIAVTSGYNNRNQLTQQTGGARLPVAGFLGEPASVTIDGSPAAVTIENKFAGMVDAGIGLHTITVVATDPSGNVRSSSYQVTVSGPSQTLVYDANGNLCGKGGTTCTNGAVSYEWDAEDRLVRIIEGAATLATFAYNGMGQRVQKTVGTLTHSYVYDGANILEERLSDGSKYDYVHGSGVDHPLGSRDQSGAASYFLADHLGSVAQVTNAAAAITLTREYDPWGIPLQGSATPGYAFTGREWDAETNLYYYRARYYDAKLGRFLSEDPIGFLGGKNFFEYVRNSPAVFTDPEGLQVYQCHRPMRLGSKKLESIPHALLYTPKCDQSYSFGPVVPPFGMGHVDPDEKPFDPDGGTKPGYQCTLESKSPCMENCLCKQIDKDKFNPNLVYALGPKGRPGYQCNDAVDKVLEMCRDSCFGF